MCIERVAARGDLYWGVKMIDTARFQWREAVPPEILATWVHTEIPPGTQRKNGWDGYFHEVEAPSGAKARFTYYPQDVHGQPNGLLMAEASLPKLVHGNNIESLSDMRPALEILEKVLYESTDLRVDLGHTRLGRIDIFHDHLLGPYVTPMIRNILRLSYPKRKTLPYLPAYGAQFGDGSAIDRFYDKFEESKRDPRAYGRMRQEAERGSPDALRRALKKSGPVFITDFTPDAQQQIIQHGLHKLGLDGTVFVDKAVALRGLIRTYGSEQGLRLFGLLCAKDVVSDAELIALGAGTRTLQRGKKACNDIGLCTALDTQAVMLPALSAMVEERHGEACCDSDTEEDRSEPDASAHEGEDWLQ